MALYRKGQASLDAQGYVTGYNTNWRESLTLIRAGATIIFNTNPISYATVNEVISDTSLRVVDSAGAVIPRGDYAILLHDSITVDGLAQDVAETLRYYQGKENEFARLIEIIKNMDPDEMGKWLEGVKKEADRAAAEAGKAHQSSLTAQGAATVAAEESAKATQQVELAKGEVTKAAAEVGKAKQEVENAKQQVILANNASDFASEKADDAAEAAGKAITEADRAKFAADRAEQLAGQLDATNLMRKDANLSDLTDKAQARRNLDVDNITSNNEETKVMTKGKDAWLSLRQSDRKWGFWDQATGQWVALGLEQGGTGAKDAAGARANLHAFQQKRNALTPSDNLNSLFGYNNTGYYHNAANANATTANNYPIAQAGVLLVTGSQANGVNQTQQYYYPFSREDIYFVRHYNLVNSVWTWTKWVEFKGSSQTLDSVGLNQTGVIGPRNANEIQRNCFFAGGGTDAQNYILPYQGGIAMRRVNTTSQMQIDAGNGQIWTRGSVDGGAWTEWRRAAMENAVVTFQNAFLDSKSDGERAASGIMNGRLLSGAGAVRHAWRVYSEIRTDNKTYMTMHLQAANGANRYLGFDQDGNLSGIGSVNCTGANIGSSGMNVNAGGECIRLKGPDANAAMYIIARNSDNSLNWYVGKGSRENDQVILHSYKYNTTLTIRQGDVITNKDMTIGGNCVTNGSTAYVDGADGNNNTHIWLRNRSKRSRAVLYANDSHALTLRSDNGATGVNGQGLVLYGSTGECRAAKFTATSDERAKFWMKPVTGALDKICQLRGMTYSMHTTVQNTVRNAGIIAQDVQKVLPEAVTVTEGKDHNVLNKNCDKVENPLSLDYNAMSALYVEAIKELKAEIDSLKARVAELESK